MNTPFSGFFLISVIGACVSTANSQLHLIGCMLSYDVASQLTKRDVGGADSHPGAGMYLHGRHGCTDLIRKSAEGHAVLGADIWGLFSAALAPLIYGGLYWKRRTKAGAVGSVLYGTYLLCPVLENGSPDILGISGNTVRGGSLCCDPDV